VKFFIYQNSGRFSYICGSFRNPRDTGMPALSEHYGQMVVKSGEKEHLTVVQIGCKVKWGKLPFVFSTQP
jgi:hypothetical protein